MNKLIYILFLAILALSHISCSSENEMNEDGSITVKESEIISNYYTGKNHNIYFSKARLYYDESLGDFKHCICDAACPIKKNHIAENSITVTYSDEKDKVVIKCRQCKAEFNTLYGIPENDIAEGYKIKVYDYRHNKEAKTYTLWERQ